MLTLKPNCEWCDQDLAPDSKLARICSYECTFCANCVQSVLHNVCPNCGGGFTDRPVRPKTEHRPSVSIQHQPASTTRVHSNYNAAQITEFVNTLKELEPEQR